MARGLGVIGLLLGALFLAVACDVPNSAEMATLTIYSGRSEELIKPLIDKFSEITSVNVQVRWGDTAELAVTILEEGGNTPADIFYAQDPGALGVLQDRFIQIPSDILERAEPQFHSPDGKWVGISGRARTVVYNTEKLSEADLPHSIWGFTDPQWKGRIGWAPTNGSFQVMVTGMRVIWGDEKTRQWLEGIQANQPKVYPKNTAQVAAAAAGEIDVGFVNHYYLFRFLAEEGEAFAARNYHTKDGDPGALMMVSGVGVLSTSRNQEEAFKFIDFLLSDIGQQYFASQSFEYPVVRGLNMPSGLVPISEIQTPGLDMRDLSDLKGTLRLLQDAGVL